MLKCDVCVCVVGEGERVSKDNMWWYFMDYMHWG